MSAEQLIQRSSTESMPASLKLDYWMTTLRQSLWPVSEWKGLQDFNVALEEAPLGCLTSMAETISAHESHRTRRDVENSRDRCYLLFANQLPWRVAHNGGNELLAQGDCVLVDSQGELKTTAPSGFHGVILKLPVDWLNTWLPEPESVVGGKIAVDSRWGKVLSPIVSQLTPDFAMAPPLPHVVLVDQLGAILALIAGDSEARAMPELLARIQDCIRQRYSDPQLTAAHVAFSLNLPPRTLHRVLAANHMTFASQLLEARTNAGLQMLTSSAFAKRTTTEIALQAGFMNVSHFARVLRKRTGRTLPELRRHID